jgi:hypothetical protein
MGKSGVDLLFPHERFNHCGDTGIDPPQRLVSKHALHRDWNTILIANKSGDAKVLVSKFDFTR